jgi:hypothetical protein
MFIHMLDKMFILGMAWIILKIISWNNFSFDCGIIIGCERHL